MLSRFLSSIRCVLRATICRWAGDCKSRAARLPRDPTLPMPGQRSGAFLNHVCGERSSGGVAAGDRYESSINQPMCDTRFACARWVFFCCVRDSSCGRNRRIADSRPIPPRPTIPGTCLDNRELPILRCNSIQIKKGCVAERTGNIGRASIPELQ